MLATSLAALALPAVGAEEIPLPSGHSVSFNDVIWGQPGPSGLTIRFRFLDPALAERADEDGIIIATEDTEYLCEFYALERITENGPQPQQIVISISDRPVAFGEPDPDVTQIFEAYAFRDGTCIWEMF
ncbi:MAG: acetolactate synthase [Maritimibacter sp.]|nr:acetolactate synthase [Maritimibacter sp.]